MWLLIAVPAAAAGVDPLPTGVSIRQSSTTSVSDTSVDAAAYPELGLISPMVPWKALEPQDDVFDFSQLDRNVEDAAAGDYRLLLRVMAGRLVPGWLLSSGAQTVEFLGTDPNAVDYCDWITVVAPWDPLLEAEYGEMLAAIAGWLGQDDGHGGTKGDHVYLVPISMPTVLGSEMQVGFGGNATCPIDTGGAGLSLSQVNADRWHALGTDADLRAWTEGAWRRAIALHMQELPANVRSVIAYGALFGDTQAAARAIAGTLVAPNRDRLWSMYTNLQPRVVNGAITGVWKDWCPACDQVLATALAAGGQVGFQVASTDRMDTHDEFSTAVEDAIPRYAMRFLETNLGALDREEAYLLTGPDPVQSRLAAIAARMLTRTAVVCDAVEIGTPSTCTATVEEVWDDPALAVTGEVTWTSGGSVQPLSCSVDAAGSCVVTVTPTDPGPLAVTATYGGDAAHLGSVAAGSIDTVARPTTMLLTCATPVLAGQTSQCEAVVTDAGAGSAVTPTGSVAWTVTGGAGLGAATCPLSGSTGEARCSVAYTPPAVGSAVVTATYGGTTIHRTSAAIATVVADARATTTSVSCVPATPAVGSATTCTATVSDVSGAGAAGPGGAVEWVAVGSGSLASSSCALAGSGTARTCSVAYTPAAGGAHALWATYGGDATHAASVGVTSISATAPDATPPTVQITAPTGTTVSKGKTTTIAATASDDRGVARVEFRVSGVLRCTDTTAPYTCAWAVPKQANVTYTITVTAVDTSGNTAVATATVKSR